MFSYNSTVLSTASSWSWPVEIFDTQLHTLWVLLCKTVLWQHPAAIYLLFIGFSFLFVKFLEQELRQKRARLIHPAPVMGVDVLTKPIPVLEKRKRSLSPRRTRKGGNSSPKAISWKKFSELVETKTFDSCRSNCSPRKLLATLVTGWRYNTQDVVEFKIEFRMDQEVFCSWKRYSDMHTYDQAIRSLLNDHELSTLAEFPRKSTFGEYVTGRDKDECFLRARCRCLEKYMQSIMYGDDFREDTRITIASYTRDFFVPHVASQM
mmetsp:Transcript_42/g.59  ORF Transcript_42/g.59 Transcript_42/m.59 type:complete len:264 (-) Transcript_42:202-993(-)